MAFQYYGGNNEVPFQGLDYSIMQPQQQSQQSQGAQIDPNMIMGIIDKLGLEDQAAGTSAAASSAGTGGAATVAGTATIPTASGGASASGAQPAALVQ